MNKISELKGIFSEKLVWNKARMDYFARNLLALFAVRTINLSEISVAFSSKATVNSRYKRLQIFFAKSHIDYTIIARLIFKMFFSKNEKIYLTIDRTNWYWGKKKSIFSCWELRLEVLQFRFSGTVFQKLEVRM